MSRAVPPIPVPASRTRSPGADLREVDQGGGGEAAEAVEVVEHREVGSFEGIGLLAGLGQRPLDVRTGEAGGVRLIFCRRHAIVS